MAKKRCDDCGGSGRVVLYKHADGTQIDGGVCSTCDGSGQVDD